MEKIQFAIVQSARTEGFYWFGGRNVFRIYLDKAPNWLQRWGAKTFLGFTWENARIAQ